MTPPSGRSSANAQASTPRWTINLLVSFGIVICIGLIAVSALLNFRVGYRSADTELDGWIYGTGGALVDMLKASLPFMIAYAARNRALATAILGVGAFLLFTAYSITAGLGFASEHRSFREAQRSGALEVRASLQDQESELSRQVQKIGPQRSESEIHQAIEAVFARPIGRRSTVGTLSQRCALNRSSTRKACAEIAELLTEAERSKNWAKAEAELKAVRAKIAALETPTTTSADPQIKSLEGVSHWWTNKIGKDDIRLALVVLVGLVFEVGSGLGLFLVTTPWRVRAANVRNPMHRQKETTKMLIEDVTRLGDIVDYSTASLNPSNRSVTITDVYADYVSWCHQSRAAPIRMSEFYSSFEKLAKEVGITIELRSGNATLLGTSVGEWRKPR